MSTAPGHPAIEEKRQPSGVRHVLGGLLFAAAQEIPRLLHPRRNQHSWFAFRFALGIFGAALVLLPLALPQSWIAAIVGLGCFLAAILLPPVLNHSAEDEKARELGAQFVLDAGEHIAEDGTAVRAQLFIGPEQIAALDANLQSLIEIPTSALTAVLLERIESGWLLILPWAGREGVFSFEGMFAERHARKAEAALRGLVRPAPLPEKGRARAAGA